MSQTLTKLQDDLAGYIIPNKKNVAIESIGQRSAHCTYIQTPGSRHTTMLHLLLVVVLASPY